MSMISEEIIEKMWQAIRKYGSGNYWTGTTGELSAMIFQLLQERDEMIQERARENAVSQCKTIGPH